jgi:hypothetical protein
LMRQSAPIRVAFRHGDGGCLRDVRLGLIA